MNAPQATPILLELGDPPPASEAAVSPLWPSGPELTAAVTELRGRLALVEYADCWALRRRLAAAALGHALVMQGGDCAELFAEVSDRTTDRKRAQLAGLGRRLSEATELPSVLIGRMAGQFAKPRSCGYEPGPDGGEIPVYRGDAVNTVLATHAGRAADPRRMLTAYDCSAAVLRRLSQWAGEPVWASHEALLIEYEGSLVRRDVGTGSPYASSGHLLWAGERTRSASGPQISLLAGVDNPVAVKLGPSTTPAEVIELIEVLDPQRQPGRLTFISRMGAGRVLDRLPALVATAAAVGAHPVWLCDPMHGNTVKLADGRKIRAVSDIVAEVHGFVEAVRASGQRPAGLHLECTPDDVTECVPRREDIGVAALPRYVSGCDPRLTQEQAEQVLDAFVDALTVTTRLETVS
ncbi:phospho-2-dehydro-3-deoxyheptonate aldolase [Microlunatus phosphovorus NM-1]|uniref:Phospho-2-dehydro-3-deoxyheptonate aldolase n=1 Tax=Microlunatus phosphovorus (strain ATCC 700054 / DSM 10555 / JCM 9379 / NBRC 101784 / NCIMB 13414 / VKM Ac-1990 / NM-1) TaxID=1032480 RepID=F5XM11_MICPN|nr:3-deoxy-7-phosphoheptulonate synthase [Microlunatus phosphovorus]BAK33890.1 phospho-2-dehydro-3-deoxyheptonate aldolase [Microlunatus phosphovorus NM-1]